MSFDSHQVMNDMLVAMQTSLADDWQEASGYAQQLLIQHKEMMFELAKLRLEGELTEQELQNELIDEQETIAAELLALQVIGKASAQRAAQAAMNVLIRAVRTAMI
ncbi:hypothetical protein [Pseudoalteromonas ulvae]|uniref:Uncharacterized protein n=1 Tax=Pseudoalteromonas ulvae TaxID=107327 RepID=A0A244CRZ2_PSEDV|nr:hypothetical protein [Pseudoalteromonas ulvae]OUL58390.1 hypothetical protein B1199_08645 [Pseudoalteromonas ulvae]